MESSRNPAVRRIMSEWKELKKNKSSSLTAHPLEDNLFEWHFTIRGSQGTDFEGGLYHGRILLPHNYPMKPPNIVFLTPNGRFEIGMKICLTVSGYHPETWQPSWSIRTVLTAIIGFMPTVGGGAIGSIDYSREVRQKMAKESRCWMCDVCKKSNEDILPEGPDEDLSVSGDLSSSVGALLEEQSRFPAAQIAIEKIEKLDDSTASPQQQKVVYSPHQDGLRRRHAVNNNNSSKKEKGLISVSEKEEEEEEEKKEEETVPDLVSDNNNNNNNDNNSPPAPSNVNVSKSADVAGVAKQPSRSNTATVQIAGFLDVAIAAVFFAILWLALNKWVVK